MEGAPMHPMPMIVRATFFMLREIEVSGIQLSDITFGQNEVTLLLPVSKVDWRAKGARRTWQCICGTYPVCPFHVLKKHRESLGWQEESTPLFFTSGGEFCSKDGVVSTIREAAQASGQQVRDPSGNWLLSGHTFRITGARTLATLGLDAITVQLLGRWGSDAVLSYLAEAPLSNLGDKLKAPLSQVRLSDRGMELEPQFGRPDCWVHAHEMFDGHKSTISKLAELQAQFDKLKNDLSNVSVNMDGIAEVVSRKSPLEEWRVDNDQSGVTHRALISLNTPPSAWTTMRGWSFAGKKHAVTYRLDEDFKGAPDCKKCPKCHRHTRLVSSSSSSEDTSSD